MDPAREERDNGNQTRSYVRKAVRFGPRADAKSRATVPSDPMLCARARVRRCALASQVMKASSRAVSALHEFMAQ